MMIILDPLDYHSREANRSDLSGFNYNMGITFKPMLSDLIQLHSALLIPLIII